MILNGTDFWIAEDAGDYRRVQRFFRDAGYSDEKLTFPTLMAKRNGSIVGIVGTQRTNSRIVAGPLLIKDSIKNKGPLMVRLMQAYEGVLKAAGVSKFFFFVDNANSYKKQIEKFGVYEAVSIKDDVTWFKREL